MARRVIVELLCDPCLVQDKNEVEGEELPPLPLIGNKPRVLVLCPRHRAEVYEPLLQMVKDYGQIVDIDSQGTRTVPAKKASPASAPARPTGDLRCPECGREDFGGPQGLGSHRFRAHGITKERAAELRAEEAEESTGEVQTG